MESDQREKGFGRLKLVNGKKVNIWGKLMVDYGYLVKFFIHTHLGFISTSDDVFFSYFCAVSFHTFTSGI